MVFYSERHGSANTINLFTSDLASGAHMYSHSLNSGILLSNGTWTHGESLRFATVGVTTMNIWEVGFTSGAASTEVEALPIPGVFPNDTCVGARLLPNPCRLALVLWGRVLVWNVRSSKWLLRCADTEFHENMSFSSDGRFFACSTTGSVIYLTG